MKRIVFFIVLFLCLNGLAAHKAGPHSNQICNVVFGFANSEELHIATSKSIGGSKTDKANQLLGQAAAVAIDFINKMERDSDIETKDYKKLESNIAGAVRLPRPRELAIVTQVGKHRQVCHQGFDYYYGNPEYNARWQKGRELLIDVAAYAFGNPRPINSATAEFIAMIVYYTHLIGDLEKGETDSLGGIGNYAGMKNELANQISIYGKRLQNPALVTTLVSELRKLNLPSTKPEQLHEQRTVYSVQIFDVLSDYIPQIISNNVDSTYVFNIQLGNLIAA